MKRAIRSGLLVVLGLILTWAIARLVNPRPHNLDINAASSLANFGPYRPEMGLREAYRSLPPAGASQTGLRLLTDNPEAWVARWKMLASARDTIDVSYFILREDVFGAAFLGHLLEKARQGVRVRLLLDAQGTVMSFASARGNDWLDTLANTRHVKVKLFRPLLNRYLEALNTVNPVAAVASEHDKILVSDRAIGMIGGRNISVEYFADPADVPDAFDDADVILKGARAARALTAAFEVQYRSDAARSVARERFDLARHDDELLLAYRAMDDWLKGESPDPQTLQRIETLGLSWRADLAKLPRLRGAGRRAVAVEASAETRLLDSRTRIDAHVDVIGQALMRLVQGARRQLLIQSPYLVLSKPAIEVLANAGRRGLKITVYTNSPVSSDNAVSQALFLEQWPELLAQVPGMRIFVSGERRTLHSKLMVFDDQVTLVGTYNLDPMSMAVNSEIMAAVWSEDFARRVTAQARRNLSRGAPAVYEYTIRRDARGIPQRDANGRPVIAFGPQDHAAPEQWRQVQAYSTLLRAVEKLPGLDPLF